MPAAKATVFLLDDDPVITSAVRDCLSAEGYAVRCANSCSAARKALGEARCDLAILDRTLPDGDGLEILKHIRSTPSLERLPVLFLSSRSSVDEKAQGLRMGADDYLSKPFSPLELAARVSALLRRRHIQEPEPRKFLFLGLEFDLDNQRVAVRKWHGVIGGVAILGTLAGTAALVKIRQPHETPAMRGFEVASAMGCFACHGPGGSGGVRNPGSPSGEIPSFLGDATIMFYVQGEEEIREWILYGAPLRSKEADRVPSALIRMPAYKGFLSDREVDDLEAYVKSVAAYEKPAPPKAEEGRRLALQMGCFGCHGTGGQGGLSNPGSFKGLIPPWDGKDFNELVRGEPELREWILQGRIARFERNPLAAYFTHGQRIQMPAYKDALKEDELEAIIAYIHWQRDRRKQDTSQRWLEPETRSAKDSVAAGERLYGRSGCAVCHGTKGRGGIPNQNYVGATVPPLNDVAEKMELFEKRDIDAVISAVDRGAGIESLLSRPPYSGQTLARYRAIRDIILKGGFAGKRDLKGPTPPMQMPAWSQRSHAAPGPVMPADIDAIIAYLLSLQS